jgi:2-octaprenyl-3-methyl-6-methoxy-1,4-benzoquinol hydroxylase
MAIGLSKLGYGVVVIETSEPKAFNSDDLPDLRVSALNRYTQTLLEAYGAWGRVIEMRSKQYQRLSVWENIDQPLHFNASDISESYLGYFVENRILQLALLSTINQEHSNNIEVIYAKATDINVEQATVILDNSMQVQASTLIGADGGNSQLRKAANIGTTGWQYEQQANVLLVRMKSAFDAATWQQFTPRGPVAFLPLFDAYASLVWYGDSTISHTIKNGSHAEIKKAVRQRFPSLLGDFDLIEKTGFPLQRMHANNYWRSNAVLVGDAAHQINPLAGQGVNLGFKDIGALLDCIKLNPITNTNKQACIDYERQRRGANLFMMSAMDAFYQTFSNDISAMKVIRNFGVTLANAAGPLKRKALKFAMGIE